MKLISLCQRRSLSSFVTTPIFYVNASPHLGHLYTSLLGDAYYRFRQLQGDDEGLFSTGTDEHGTKVQQAASERGLPLSQYCDDVSLQYRKLFDDFGVGYTRFIRTTEAEHKAKLKWFWNLLLTRGHISHGRYSGWYCDADEAFVEDYNLSKSIVNGEEILLTADSGRPVHWVEEPNYTFDLSKVKDDVKHWLKESVKPDKFRGILLNSFEEGVADKPISISRPKTRVHWGTEVPSDPSQTVYVWLDALVNYLTVGHPHSWPPTLQLVGKDIMKFHGIYWPSFLIAAGLDPPQTLAVHSHWTVDGEKMSKSKGNVVCPSSVASLVTAEGLRYFLLREGTLHSDSNYTETKLLRVVNSELADTFGNLLNRCCAQRINHKQIYPSGDSVHRVDGEEQLRAELEGLKEEVGGHFEDLNFYKGIAKVMSTLHCGNKFFESAAPWKEKDAEKLNSILHLTLETLRIAGICLSPIIPQLCGNLLNKLNVPDQERFFSKATPSWLSSPTTARPLAAPNLLLFKKIQCKA